VTGATCDDGVVADNGNETAAGARRADEPDTDQHPTTGKPAAGERVTAGRQRSPMRDMLLSMIILAVAVLVLAGITKGCSFSPGGPSTDSANLPTVDPVAELQAAAGQVGFPLRRPHVPAGWRANSDAVDPLGPNRADKAVRIGWVTADGHFLQLSQSDAAVLDLVRATAGIDPDTDVRPTGTRQVHGTKWTVYPGIRDESSWVADLGVERLFITGNGTDAEFRTLATAALTGPKVRPANGP
jgi:hypothetical protein